MKTFSKEEIVAVYKAAYLMVVADGMVMSEEIEIVDEAMNKLGASNTSTIADIKTMADKISEEECYGQLAFLDQEQKILVSAMLGAISSSDGDIDDAELEYGEKYVTKVICLK